MREVEEDSDNTKSNQEEIISEQNRAIIDDELEVIKKHQWNRLVSSSGAESSLNLKELVSGTRQVAASDKSNESKDELGKNPDDNFLTGLAISGGGIRSASFGLGVMQGLNKYGVFKYLDYLSTVSGGGYVGSCYTWLNSKDDYKKEFPFDNIASGGKNDLKTKTLNYFRQHGNFLIPGHFGLNGASILGVLFKNIVYCSILFFFLLVAMVAFTNIALDLFSNSAYSILMEEGEFLPLLYIGSGVTITLVLIAGVFIHFLRSKRKLAFGKQKGSAIVATLYIAFLLMTKLVAMYFLTDYLYPDFNWVNHVNYSIFYGLLLAFFILVVIGITRFSRNLDDEESQLELKGDGMTFCGLVIFSFFATLLILDLNMESISAIGAEYLLVDFIKYMIVSSAIIFLLICMVSAIRGRFYGGNVRINYRRRIFWQSMIGKWITYTVCLVVIWSIYRIEDEVTKAISAGTFSISGLLGVLYQYKISKNSQKDKTPTLTNLRVVLTAALLIIGILMLALMFYRYLDVEFEKLLIVFSDWWYYASDFAVVITALAIFFILGMALDSNRFGLGRMYSDRLSETFLPNLSAILGGIWEPATEARKGYLHKFNSVKDTGPYHILNTNVVLSDSNNSRVRSRGGENFIFSSLYCGSNNLGWHETEQINGGKITLSTVMAISGAALNPNAAVAGQGVTRNRLVSFLLAFFNLRLGYWFKNPTKYSKEKSKRSSPNLIKPGLIQGLLGMNLNEESSYLELTDGGHFDNTGVYELLKRKCKLIILSEAGADP
ncbi:MAG: patatin-like phospholipase family protein, partial [Kangiellaceae bacterium]|nr:patatin-like phospholipase family protein [Kangiellaceae bacterium]